MVENDLWLSPKLELSQQNKICSQSQGFEDVSSSSNASVNHNLDSPFCYGSTFSKGIQRGGDRVKLSPTMIRDHHAIETVVDSGCYIFSDVN